MRNYGPRHVFMAIAICLLLFSPIIWLLAPVIVTETAYYVRDGLFTYVYPRSYWIYGIAVGALVAAPLILWLANVKKWTVFVALSMLVVSGVCFYGAALGYFQVTEESIVYRYPFESETQQYEWNDVEEVIYHVRPPEAEDPSWYTFRFKDGDSTEVNETRFVTQAQGKLNSLIRGQKIPLTYDELEN